MVIEKFRVDLQQRAIVSLVFLSRDQKGSHNQVAAKELFDPRFR